MRVPEFSLAQLLEDQFPVVALVEANAEVANATEVEVATLVVEHGKILLPAQTVVLLLCKLLIIIMMEVTPVLPGVALVVSPGETLGIVGL